MMILPTMTVVLVMKIGDGGDDGDGGVADG